MKKGCIKSLIKGISLEKSGTLVPWKTCFSDLRLFGNPETKTQPGRRMVIWKNETILDGISVDLNVTLTEDTKGGQLENVSAYISESDFKKVRTRLNAELKKKGCYTRFNEGEYAYTWKVSRCDVVLSHIDRFGSYWKIDINHRGSFIDRIKKCTIYKFKLPCIKTRLDHFHNFLCIKEVITPQAQLVVI
jgi:hypothetical protein